MKKLLIAACVGLLAFSACKDDKDDATPSTSNGGQTGVTITGKDWRMTANTMTVSGTGTPLDGTTDNYAEMEDCEKDNLTRFNEDKTMTEKAGATKCDPSDPDSENAGTWELMNNNTKIKITPSGAGSDPQIYDVVTLTENTLSVSLTSSSNGATMVLKVTFTKN